MKDLQYTKNDDQHTTFPIGKPYFMLPLRFYFLN